jgi:hypothetical protein
MATKSLRAVLAADAQLGAGNVVTRLLAHGADPDGPGLTFDTPVDGHPARQAMTLGQLDERIAARASWLHEYGIVARDPVAVYTSTAADCFLNFMALCRLGAIPALMNPNIPGDIAAEYIRRLRGVGVITDSEHIARLDGHQLDVPIIAEVDQLGTGDPSRAPAPYRHHDEDPIAITHSSGTTRLPTAVVHSHASLFAATRRIRLAGPRAQGTERVLSALPAPHTAGILTVNQALVNRAELLFLSRQALAALQQRLDADASAPQAAPELALAADAIRGRDLAGYRRALSLLAEAERQRIHQQELDALLERVQAAHPALAQLLAGAAQQVGNAAGDASAVGGDAGDDAGGVDWPGRLADWAGAWAYAQASTFFLRQRQPGRERELEAELDETIVKLRSATASLAAAKAWGYSLRRMTAHHAQALQAYEQHMRAVGKGTGRYAARYRGLARAALKEARDAVPAWIMPLDVVLETLAPVRDSFDVVIVDEASQASMEDLFLLWLAPRVIVVGDDKQCAPSSVRLGELEPIFAKLSSYLPQLPAYLRDAFTPKSSLFDLLRTRFGAVIALREHFRCMPEIIELVGPVLRRPAAGAVATVRRGTARPAALGPGAQRGHRGNVDQAAQQAGGAGHRRDDRGVPGRPGLR